MSLLEVMVVVGMSLVLLGLGTLNFHDPTRKAQSQGLAGILAEELRSARQLAVARREPVALVIPGGEATAQGFYLASGASVPRRLRSYDLAREFPTARLAVGWWATDPSPTTLTPPRGASSGEDFAVAPWVAPLGTDYCFIFTPAGSLVTNDLPAYDGNYHLLVANGVAASASGPPPGTGRGLATPPAYYQITGAYEPYTISLSPMGTVTLEKGVPGAPGLDTTTPVSTAPPAPVPPPSQGPNQDPLIVATDCQPDPANAILPAGVSASVAIGDHLTLTVKATDPDGDQLYCRWTSTPPGAFSTPTEVAMEWDAPASAWRAAREWVPPPAAVPGDQFVLNCEVLDKRGGSATDELLVNGVVQAIVDQRVFFYSNRDGNKEIYVMNVDGSDQTNLTNHPANDDLAVGAPQGGTVLFRSYRSSPAALWALEVESQQARQLTLAYAEPTSVNWYGTKLLTAALFKFQLLDGDGTNSIDLATQPGYPNPGTPSLDSSFSLQGDQIAFTIVGTPDHTLYVADFSPTAPYLGTCTSIIGGPEMVGSPSFSPDGTRLYYHRQVPGNQYDIWVCDWDRATRTASNFVDLTPHAASDLFPSLSPDGTEIAFESTRSGNRDIWKMKSDGTELVNLTNDPGNDQQPSWTRGPSGR